jgi:hypothetical protein
MRTIWRTVGRYGVSLVAVILLTAGCALAQSQPNQPRPSQPTTDRANPAPTPVSAQESDAERQRRERELAIQDRVARWTVVLAVVGGIVGALQILLMFMTWFVTNKAANAAKASADEAKRAGDVAAGALAVSQRAERAYVTMSHEPPGLEIDTAALVQGGQAVANQDVRIRVKVTNGGNTPARVKTVSVQTRVGKAPLPAEPPHDAAAANRVSAFLVKNDSFIDTRKWTIPSAQIADIRSVGNLMDAHPTKLWVFGYVDYVDQFDVRHRSGYARVYDPTVDQHPPNPAAPHDSTSALRWKARNNLPFETQAGYNFDRPRQQGEGDDWA